MSDEIAPQIKAPISWYLGTVVAFLIFVLFALYASRITNNFPDDDAQRSAERYKTRDKVEQAENLLLNPTVDNHPTAKWANQDKGLIAVPIDQAMATEVNELKSQAPAQAAEIPAAAPAPKPAPAGAAPAPAAGAPPATNAPAAAAPSAPATNAPATSEPAGKKGAKK